MKGSSDTSTTRRVPREMLAETQVGVAHRVVAEELELLDRRQPDADGGAVVARPAVARPRIGVVAADHHVEDPVDVVDRAGHHADAVQRLARRYQSDGADQTRATA